MTKAFQALLIASMVTATAAADFRGKVVGVTDGDTVTVLRYREQVKIRLTEIDAPERKQPFGERSRQSLAELVFRKEVLVIDQGTDRYGRTLGRLKLGSMDANEEQLRRGMAWVYDKYVVDRALYRIQDEAKRQRKGLWADPKPVPPWDWRRVKRRSKPTAARP